MTIGVKKSRFEWALWASIAFITSFWCLALVGCEKPIRPPLPPASVTYCRTMVLVTPDDLCGTMTNYSPFYQCVKCQGGEGCIAKDIGVYCVSGGCDDPVCSR